MFTYAFKNLRSLFTRQKLLSLLLVLNIIVSCLVICFAYGVYKNFHELEKAGMYFTYDAYAQIKNEDVEFIDDTYIMTYDITPEQMIELVKSFSPDTQKAMAYASVNFLTKTPLFYVPIESPEWEEGMTEEEWDEAFEAWREEDEVQLKKLYSDDDEQNYTALTYHFKIKDGMVVAADPRWGNPDAIKFTDEQYNNGERVLIASSYLIHDESDDGWQSAGWQNAHIVPVEEADLNDPYTIVWDFDPEHAYVHDYRVQSRNLSQDITEIMLGGEKYTIIGYSESVVGCGVEVPITAAPPDSQIYIDPYSDESYIFSFSFEDPLTTEQYIDIQKCIKEKFGDSIRLADAELADQYELKFFRTVAVIAVIIAILAAVNMAILYRYILEKRSSELAIFRICGCSKGKAIGSYLLECLIINIPLFIATQFMYHKLIRPQLLELFPYMKRTYGIKTYLVMFGLYIAASIIIMLVMIWWSVKKHSLVALKSAPKATSKFGIMKIFEILQLAIVLSIMVVIVSAIMAKFEKFEPFRDLLSRRGYVMMINGMGFGGDDINETRIAEVIGEDNDSILTILGEAQDFDENYTGDSFEGVSYPDELIDIYTPPMLEGVWLSDTDESYEKDGYIPIVMTYCDGKYHAGDMLINDIPKRYDENGQPIGFWHIEYKIVGILQDNIDIIEYFDHYEYELNDYTDLYGDQFVYGLTKAHVFMRKSDSIGYWSENSDYEYPLMGIQYFYFDDMNDDDFRRMGDMLEREFHSIPVTTDELYQGSMDYIFEQMYTLFPIAVCIFILTIISTVSISAIYTKRQLRNYAIFYICGARWRTCALKSVKNGAITCAASAVLSALLLIIGKATILKDTVITFGLWHLAICAGVIILYLILSMIMPMSIIGSSQPREVLKEE